MALDWFLVGEPRLAPPVAFWMAAKAVFVGRDPVVTGWNEVLYVGAPGGGAYALTSTG